MALSRMFGNLINDLKKCFHDLNLCCLYYEMRIQHVCYVYVSMMYMYAKWLFILEHVFWLLGENMGYRWPLTVGYNNRGICYMRCLEVYGCWLFMSTHTLHGGQQ